MSIKCRKEKETTPGNTKKDTSYKKIIVLYIQKIPQPKQPPKQEKTLWKSVIFLLVYNRLDKKLYKRHAQTLKNAVFKGFLLY